MKNKESILITGISGYIGSVLARELSGKYTVIGLDQERPKDPLPDVHYHSLDLTSEDHIRHTLLKIRAEHGQTITSVIHLVAYYSFDGLEDERYETITVNGTRNLLRLLRENFHVEQFIFSSSMLVYKPVSLGEKIKDDSPLAPSWPYPQSKVRAEKVLQEERGTIPVVNLRIAGVYDENCHQPTLAQQIIRIHEGWATSVPFPGNPRTGQSILHLKDLARLIPKLIEKRNEFSPFETFAVGEEDVMSYQEIQDKLGLLLHNRPWPVLWVPKWFARLGAMVMERLPIIREPFIKPWMISRSDEHFDVDMTRIKSMTGWTTDHHLNRELPIIINNLKRNPHRWYEINKIEKPFYRELDSINGRGEKNQIMAALANIFLGIWIFSNPFSFRQLERGEFYSELVIGFFITLLSVISLLPTLRWCRWANAGLGCLLMLSPLVFHTRSDAAFLSDTLLGGLVILLSAYTPPKIHEDDELGLPPGWTYNPSTAGQRLPIMLLAFLGFLFSRYLASFQLGHIQTVWDPFFKDGTMKVLTSDISKAFPVSDAGLGSLTYLLDVVAACIGGRSRWRTMPWAVILFGFMIIPTGVTSITLVMLQPIGVGAWCSICLVTAFIMLIMVPPSIDEVLASVQFLKQKKKEGESFWKVFWFGGQLQKTVKFKPIRSQGNLVHLYLVSLVGIWLMFAPVLLNIQGIAASNIFIVSSLVITFSIIAISEAARIGRLLNIPLAAWLAVSPWILGEMSERAQWHSLIVALVIILLSFPRGKRSERFGSADRIIHWRLGTTKGH